jgi:spore coat polysaccharide biosynthesis protein SpsF
MLIGALVPARLTSERLKRKALLPIAGRPAIAHLFDRIAATRYVDRRSIVLCTTKDASDDPLVSLAEREGVSIFRGSSDDIVDRFYQAVQCFRFDAVIQADGDDPCTDAMYMEVAMEHLLCDPMLDIVVTEGLPLGLNSKAIRASAINQVWRHYLTTKNDHGFILYFTKTGLCNVGKVQPRSTRHTHPTARLTLDYPEDLEFFRALFRLLYADGRLFGVEDIVQTLKESPELLAINSGRTEEYWTRTRDLLSLRYCDDGVVREVAE